MIQRLKTISIAIFAVYIFLIVFATITWNYRPTIYTNTKYKTISNINIKNINKNALYVSQHKSGYTMFEQMILCEEIIKSGKKFNIVSNSNNPMISEFFKKLPKGTPYTLIDIDKNIKNNKTKELITKLKNKENVLIFLFEKDKSKGIYYILKETKKPLILINIEDKEDKLDKIFNKNMELSYRKLDNYPIEKKPEDFMIWLKDKLYNEKIFNV